MRFLGDNDIGLSKPNPSSPGGSFTVLKMTITFASPSFKGFKELRSFSLRGCLPICLNMSVSQSVCSSQCVSLTVPLSVRLVFSVSACVSAFLSLIK